MRRGLVESRTEAQEVIAAGLVTVDGGPAHKSTTQVHGGQAVTVHAPPPRFVSRGGEKLEHSLDVFGIDVSGRPCLDAGISTGGFTDVLLQRGAVHVEAYDVGYGQVHERIRVDDRVTVHERTNIRDVTPADLDGPRPEIVVCDLSFISVRLVLPVLVSLCAPGGQLVALVKPQFEADREDVGRGGVVRDADVWSRVLHAVAQAAAELDWHVVGITASPLLGASGNVEFLAHLRAGADERAPRGTGQLIAAAVDEGRRRREAQA